MTKAADEAAYQVTDGGVVDRSIRLRSQALLYVLVEDNATGKRVWFLALQRSPRSLEISLGERACFPALRLPFCETGACFLIKEVQIGGGDIETYDLTGLDLAASLHRDNQLRGCACCEEGG